MAFVFLQAKGLAVSFLTAPAISRPIGAPLAGLLTLATDVPTRVRVAVNDGSRTWERSFYEYRVSHSIPVLGFKPDRTNEITVTVYDQNGVSLVSTQLTLVTSPLPFNFPPITVRTSKPDRMEPGYTLFRNINQNSFLAFVILVDSAGEVVWYSGLPSNFGITRLPNGNLLYPFATYFREIDMLGQTVRTLPLPSGLPYTHDAYPTDHGTILWLAQATRVVPDFPTSATNPSAPRLTANICYNPVMEMSLDTGETVNTWQTVDLLDTNRITYLTFSAKIANFGWDWSHANAVFEDPRDHAIIMSMRHQNAVIKISRETGQLIWILGPHENWAPEFQKYLLTPVGSPFDWNYAQHAAMVTPQGTILLWDNGNFRASPFDLPVADEDNFSRAAEFAIDEQRMEVSQVWEYGQHTAEWLFSPSRGDANWLPQKGNVLMTYADAAFINGTNISPRNPAARMLRIVEVTHPPTERVSRQGRRHEEPCGPAAVEPSEIVFDIAMYDYGNTNSKYNGFSGYRAERVPDLYPVSTPAQALADLLQAVIEADLQCQWRLTATLRAAQASVERHPNVTIAFLKVFQKKLSQRIAPDQPELANQLLLQAQSIIDALQGGQSPWCSARSCRPFPVRAECRQGKPRLEFTGDEAQIYLIEASSDLAHWETIGVARHKGRDDFDYVDSQADRFATRFYRVKTPARN